MLYADQMHDVIPAEQLIPRSYREIEEEGKRDVTFFEMKRKNEVQEPNSLKNTKGFASYDRIAARDYALTYSSNATNYCKCGKLYGVDYSSWNNDEYPYFPNACHSDCADFVSQAMHAGGIPLDPGKWERLKDGNNDWAWTNIRGLKAYMTSKGYWNESNFSNCNAGNILLTSSGHIVMITLNDGITHRYSGHTRDRNNLQFYNLNEYKYYAINTD